MTLSGMPATRSGCCAKTTARLASGTSLREPLRSINTADRYSSGEDRRVTDLRHRRDGRWRHATLCPLQRWSITAIHLGTEDQEIDVIARSAIIGWPSAACHCGFVWCGVV